MDTSSGRVIGNEQLERLKLVDPREADKFSLRLDSLVEAARHHPTPTEVTYTEEELSDLEALRNLRHKMTPQSKSGNPARKNEAVVTLEAVEIEVAKVHRAAEARAGVVL